MLDLVKKYLEEQRVCPHCKAKLTLCHAPPMHVGDGLGWGSEFLFICLNDSCSLFVNGWDYIDRQFGHVGSYRHMELPSGGESYNMMVGAKEAFTGSIVDLEAIEQQDKRYRREQEALAALDACVAKGDLKPVLYLLRDEAAGPRGRLRAAALLTELDDAACIEPLRLHTFRNADVEQAVNLAINQILESQCLKECPYCAELIKMRAVICKHCKKELA